MKLEAARQEVAPAYFIEDRKATRTLWIVVALLAGYGVWRFPFWLAHSNLDLTQWFLPWLSHILSVGRFHSLEASYANYNPAFVYMLVGSSFLAGIFSPITVVKLTNLPFLLLAGAVVFFACRQIGYTLQRALVGGALILVAPEVMENAWSWGQCDIIYSAFLLSCLVAAWLKRPTLSMLCFGMALSLKLQALFLGPVVLMMLLAGELPIWTVLLVPLTYFAMLLPAMLAGRPAASLIFIYGAQYNLFNGIGYQVANPYTPLVSLTHYVGLIKQVGFLAAIASNIAFLVYLWHRRRVLKQLSGLALLGAMSLILEVFMLPKMHERYYFPANLLLLLLVAINPRRFWLPAILMQAVSVFTYGSFLYDATRHGWEFILAALLVAYVFWLLVKEVERLQTATQPAR